MSITARTISILGFLLGILSLTILPWSCTCSCSGNNGIGGDWNPLYHKIVFSRFHTSGDSPLFNTRGTIDIYKAGVDGTINLTDTPDVAESLPHWSPDGTKIAYYISEEGNGDICVMNADGTNKTNLTDTPDWDEDIAFRSSPISNRLLSCWSPDGTKISYMSKESPSNGGNRDLYVMNADGTNKTNLTNTPDISEYWITWLPDNKISYRSSYDLYVMDSDGSNKTKLASASYFMWSPDGSKLLFFTEDIPPWGDIHVMDADGSNPITVIDSSIVVEEVSIEWSPDGSKIAFSRINVDEQTTDIYVVNAAGSGLTNLTNEPESDGYGPHWSPDGSKIAFQVFNEAEQGIYIMNADGSNRRPLAVTVRSETAEPDEPLYPSYWFSLWSPDGTKIALLCREHDEDSGFISDIYMVNSDGADIDKCHQFHSSF